MDSAFNIIIITLYVWIGTTTVSYFLLQGILMILQIPAYKTLWGLYPDSWRNGFQRMSRSGAIFNGFLFSFVAVFSIRTISTRTMGFSSFSGFVFTFVLGVSALVSGLCVFRAERVLMIPWVASVIRSQAEVVPTSIRSVRVAGLIMMTIDLISFFMIIQPRVSAGLIAR